MQQNNCVDNTGMLETWFSSVSVESTMYKNPSLTEHTSRNIKASLDEELYFTQHQTIRHSTPAAPRNNGYAVAGKLNLKYFRTTWYFRKGKVRYFSSVRFSYQWLLDSIVSSKWFCWRDNFENARPGDGCCEMVLLSSWRSIGLFSKYLSKNGKDMFFKKFQKVCIISLFLSFNQLKTCI